MTVLLQDTLMRDKFDFRYTGQAVEDDTYNWEQNTFSMGKG
ncbi:MAG: hypothetical protein ACLU4N_26820 [Butyricimonas faecihominis]